MPEDREIRRSLDECKARWIQIQIYKILKVFNIVWMHCDSFYRVVDAVDKAASREERDVVDDMLETQHLSGEVMSKATIFAEVSLSAS